MSRGTRIGWTVLMVAAVVLTGFATAYAQGDAVKAGTAGNLAQRMTWKEMFVAGGWLMWVLLLMSIVAVTFVVYFYMVLRATRIAPRALLRELVEKIRAGNLEDARRICDYRPCPLSSMALVAMEYVRTSGKSDPAMLKDIIEGEGSRQAESIQGQTQFLLDIAVIAPMVGLLGTVFGMLDAFSAVALNIASAKPAVLANGVAKAIITTAFGLIIGIPSMAFYAYFRRKASNLVCSLEESGNDILTALTVRR